MRTLSFFSVCFFSLVCNAQQLDNTNPQEKGITNVNNGRITNIGNGLVTNHKKNATVVTAEIDLEPVLITQKLQLDPEILEYQRSEMLQEAPFSRPIPKNFSEKIQAFRTRSKSISSNFELPSSDTDKIATATVPIPWSIYCNAAWDEECEDTQRFTPPYDQLKQLGISFRRSNAEVIATSWEICKFTAVVDTKSDNASWAIKGADVNGITFWVKSRGSHIFYDRWGSDVRIRLANVTYIIGDKPSTQAERNKAQCSYSNNGSVSSSSTQDMLFCAADPFNPGSTIGVQMCGDYIWQDGGRRMIRGPYACGVCAKY